MPTQSSLPGYSQSPFRDHSNNMLDSRDMEPANQPLYAGQAQVPRLPVPDLAHTKAVFLESCRPHVSEEEYKTTTSLMEDFARPGGMGETLQRRLLQRKDEEKDSSWLSKWWNKYAYLEYRDTVVWNVSYYLQFRDEGPAAMLSPTRRAARFVRHALTYRDQLVAGELAPDMGKSAPMSNSQHKFLFNTCRMPGAGSDFVRTFAPDLHQHIVVARKNRFFAVDVYDAAGKPLAVDAVQIQLDRVVAYADSIGTATSPVGILSAGNRDDWLAKRALVLQGPGNEASLYAIESSIFMVCLDDISPTTREQVGRALLHSDGRNRFWDKSFMAVFFENGKAGLIGEHSMMDGLTSTRFVNETLARMVQDVESDGPSRAPTAKAPYGPNAPSALAEPRFLKFTLTPDAVAGIKDSEQTFDAFIATKELKVLMFHGYGKQKIKTFKVSPDAFAQMAIQLAYRKTFGHCRGTYESTQTRTFLHGRTEVTRSVSQQSELFCDAMTGARGVVPTRQERTALLQSAATQHSKYTKLASQGMGCDRHLLGLKLCMQAGESHPFFDDVAYKRSGTWAISTSGLVGELMDGWGFGEVVPDGIGVGYSVLNETLRFTVSSCHKWADKMVANLEQSLVEMAGLFVGNQLKAKL